MELKDALLKRRSVREFTSDDVKNEDIEEILHAAMSGPSACNRKPWDFYVVKNEEILAKLRLASRFSNIKSKLAIVVCGNLSKALPLQLAEYWIQDCSAATENILLRVVDLNLGAVWCGIYPQKRPIDKVKEALNLSNKQIPLNIIYIGYPKEESNSRDQYDEKRIHYVE